MPVFVNGSRSNVWRQGIAYRRQPSPHRISETATKPSALDTVDSPITKTLSFVSIGTPAAPQHDD